MSAPTGYLDRVIAAALSGSLKPGAVTVINVQHDDDCPRLQDGPCTCSPNVVMQKPQRANVPPKSSYGAT